MVGKKIFFSILSAVLVLPAAALADGTATGVGDMAGKVKDASMKVGVPLIVVGWVVAGILYLTSAGSPERTGTAKKAIVAAVIGTVLIALAIGAGEFIATLFGLTAPVAP